MEISGISTGSASGQTTPSKLPYLTEIRGASRLLELEIGIIRLRPPTATSYQFVDVRTIHLRGHSFTRFSRQKPPSSHPLHLTYEA